MRIETLEDRLAPAGLAPLDFFTPLFAVWESRHPNVEVPKGAVFRVSDQGFRVSEARIDDAGNHPLLDAVVDNLHKLVDAPATPQLAPTNAPPSPSFPSPTQGQTGLMSTMLPTVVNPIAASVLPHLGTATLTSPLPPLGSHSILPLPADLPSFTPPLPSTPRPATQAGPLAFELSPFTPFGLDIVPVPVPRGLEEGLADLFGSPASAPAPSADGLLAPSINQEAARIAVQELLHENAPVLGPHTPLPVISARPAPTPQREGTILAGTPLDPAEDAEDEQSIHPASPRAIVSLLAAGVSLFVHHLQPLATSRRRPSGLVQREPSGAKPCR